MAVQKRILYNEKKQIHRRVRRREGGMKQIIVTIGREFGSGGRVIAQMLAKELQIPLYDKNMIAQALQDETADYEQLEKFDEKPSNPWLVRTIRDYSTSLSDNVAQQQFAFLKKEAEAGHSFVAVGRCAENVLREADTQAECISIFIVGDAEEKRKRLIRIYGVEESEAVRQMERIDRERRAYHNSYFRNTWREAGNYDLMVNSSRLGVERTAAFLEKYIRMRMEQI